MCGRNDKKVRETARRFGYRGYYTDWRRLVDDQDVAVIDNCTPDNLHCEPSIGAAESGKHVICEKPLSMSVEEARKMVQAVEKAGVKHMCCYNYRFVPAVRLAREIIERGMLGKIYQFRACYLQEPGHDPSEILENIWYASGTRSGVLLGIGCHIIDMARFLVGEIASVSGMVRTFNTSRKKASGGSEKVMADEGNLAMVAFENGAIGTLESSGVSTGRRNRHTWEINGSEGSLAFDLEDLNHLHVHLAGVPSEEIEGFSNVSVTGFSVPLSTMILPPGHNAGWEYGHVHALGHFMDCVVNDKPVGPYGATFHDGYRVQVIMEAILQSSKTGKRIDIVY
jgi:predicted dehydrogenase